MLSTHKLSQLAAEDFRPSIVTGDALLQNYSINSDNMQELLGVTLARVIDDFMADLDTDLEELKYIRAEFHRLVAVRQAYMESITIKTQTKYLLTSRDISGSEEREYFNALLIHVGKVRALIDSLYSDELHTLHCELEEHAELIEQRKNEAADAATKTAALTLTKSELPTPIFRASTLTMKLPSFDGDMVNWRKFWGLFSSKLDHESGLLDIDKSCLIVNSMETRHKMLWIVPARSRMQSSCCRNTMMIIVCFITITTKD